MVPTVYVTVNHMYEIVFITVPSDFNDNGNDNDDNEKTFIVKALQRKSINNSRTQHIINYNNWGEERDYNFDKGDRSNNLGAPRLCKKRFHIT